MRFGWATSATAHQEVRPPEGAALCEASQRFRDAQAAPHFLLLGDAVEVLLAAQEHRVADDGR